MSEADAYRKNAKLAYKARNFTGAADLYAKVLEIDPGAAPEVIAADRVAYAAALTSANRLDEAAVQLEMAVGHAPQDARLRYKLGQVHSRLGRHDEAVEQLEETVRLEPQVADHHWRLAAELRTLGRTTESAAALKEALKIEPNHSQARILELEQLLISTPERDGQFDDAAAMNAVAPPKDLWSGGRPGVGRGPFRHRPWMVAAEALLILLLSLWIQSQFL